jgi:amidophosphoribosyltransferase
MVRATGLPQDAFCMACYNGKYPVPYDAELDKNIMERRRAGIESLVGELDKDAMQIKLL